MSKVWEEIYKKENETRKPLKWEEDQKELNKKKEVKRKNENN